MSKINCFIDISTKIYLIFSDFQIFFFKSLSGQCFRNDNRSGHVPGDGGQHFTDPDDDQRQWRQPIRRLRPGTLKKTKKKTAKEF